MPRQSTALCVLDDGPDVPGLLMENQESGEESDEERRNVLEHIHRMPFSLSTSG